MNLRDLQYFVATAKHRHISRAAAAVHVSQPTLSMQLRKLEALLGGPLFERQAKTLLLTPLGHILLPQAEAIVAQAAQLLVTAKAAAKPLHGPLNLGVFPTLAPYHLPDIVPLLARQLPDMQLFLHEEKTDQLLSNLRQGALDLALLALPVPDGFCHASLFEDPFYLAVPAAHALAQQPDISLTSLPVHELLLLEEGHCLREQALSVCHPAQPTTTDFRATSLETLRQMVAAGRGVTLIPRSALPRISQANEYVRYIPFSPPAPARTIALVWRASDGRQSLIKAVLSTLTLDESSANAAK